MGRRPSRAPRLRDAENAAFASRAEHGDDLPRSNETTHLRRGSSDVQDGQRQPLRNVFRELRVRRAREKDGLAVDVELRGGPTHDIHTIDAKRSQSERGQGSQAIAWPRRGLGLPAWGYLDDATHEHSARPGDGIVLLA